MEVYPPISYKDFLIEGQIYMWHLTLQLSIDLEPPLLQIYDTTHSGTYRLLVQIHAHQSMHGCKICWMQELIPNRDRICTILCCNQVPHRLQLALGI